MYAIYKFQTVHGMDLTDSVLAGRYKVYGELCRGYYGITWGAFDLSAAQPGSKVCIKVRFNIDN